MLHDSSGGRIPTHDWLEQMADDRVQDDQSMHRDPKRDPFTHRTSKPQWCLAGLTRSQKTRIQRLRQLEIIEEEREQTLNKKGVKSQVWRVKPKADDKQAPDSSAAPINMVSMMPKGFV